MIYVATNIEWDTDGEDIDLPNTLEIDVPDSTDAEDIDEYISDELSNITGFCYFGFSLTVKQ